MAYLDEGLDVFRTQWKKEHSGATVYWLADENHSQNPRVSQHAPDDGKSGGPGDTPGEGDAVDVMRGKTVTQAHLKELFYGLHESRDPRLLYAIFEDEIFSSVMRPWEIRNYSGDWHGHVHISVNDNFKANTAAWDWKEMPLKKWNYVEVQGVKIAELNFGDDDDAYDGYAQVARAQALMNWIHKGNDLDVDGVYGANTVQKVKAIWGGNGRTLTVDNIRKLKGT